MTAETTNADLKALIEAGFAQVEVRFAEVHAEQRRQAEAIAEVHGQLKILAQWVAGIDGRFTALMRPYEPPKKSA